MKYKFFAIVMFFSAVGFSISAQKKAFSISDLYKVKYVGNPVLSHSGTRVAFTVTTSNLKKAKSNTEIFVMNIDGSGLKQLTNNEASDFNPIWNSDDSKLFFSSTRTGKVQLFCLPISGGEAKQITDYKLGVSSAKLAPDEKSIIFQAKIFPECGTDIECNIATDNRMKNGPIQAHIADSLFIRHWTEYNDGKYSHLFLYNLATENTIDLTPGFFNSPAFSAGGSDHYVYSSDSKHIAFDSKRVKHPEASTNTDIFVVNSAGENLTNITKGNLAADFNPVYSPDGKYIAYLTQQIPKYESDRIRLAIYDVQSGENSVITELYDNWVSNFKWSHDSKAIYFTGHEKGYMPLLKVDVTNNEIEKIIPQKVIREFVLSPDDKFVVYSASSVNEPTELEYLNLATGRNIRLTRFNKSLTDSIDFRPVEERWVKGAEGKMIQVFLVKPHNFDAHKKYPLIINVHGGPQYQWMNSFRGDWQVYPGAGYLLAFPNPHGSTGFGQEFTASISNDWDGKVYEDVMKVTDYLSKLEYVDNSRMGAMGWSYGGYFMNLLQAKTNRFKCLVSMMGIYDLKEFKDETEELWFPNWDLNRKDFQKMSPSMYEDNFTTPALIISGEKDYRIPYTQSIRYFTVLQNKGIDSRLIIFKNDGHWPSSLRSMPLYYNAHLEWFHKYLGGEKAPWNSHEMVKNNYLK